MKQQRLFGFFHQFTPEGRRESAQASPVQSPKLRLSHNNSTSSYSKRPNAPESHDSTAGPEQQASLDIPPHNVRNRQVSEASSVGSKRSREGDIGDAETNHSPTPKAPKIARVLIRTNSSRKSEPLTSPNPKQDEPSSSLTVLSQTPSIPTQRQQSFVRSSQDSEDSDELDLMSASHHGPAHATITSALSTNNHDTKDDEKDNDKVDGEDDEDEDEDDDSSLGDLRGFTPKHKRQVGTPSRSPQSPTLPPQSTQISSAKRTTRTTAGTARRQDYYEPHYFDPRLFEEPERVEPKAKFSLARLIKQNQKEAAEQIEIARHLQVLEAAQQDQDQEVQKIDTPAREDLLASLLNSSNNETNGERLKLALGRIEAMKTSTHWRFFNVRSPSAANAELLQFPAWKLADDVVWCHLCDPALREHAFLTGFATDLFRRHACPAELLRWLWASFLAEKREHLAKAYSSALQVCPIDAFWLPNFSDALKSMGACDSALSVSDTIAPHESNVAISLDKESAADAIAGLPLLLDYTQAMSARLQTSVRSSALTVLLKMGIDTELMANMAVKTSLQGCVHRLVQSFDEESAAQALDECSRNLFRSVDNMMLRANLIAAMPDTSTRLRLFKQRLALAFYLDDAKLLDTPLPDVENMGPIVAAKLHSIDVSDDSIDYSIVAARISLLDVAIGAGFVQNKPSDGKSEDNFNARIDFISKSVKQLFARIMDTGASHMARTEAKSQLERLQYRLDFAVRTRPPARLNIYEDVMVGRGLMQNEKGAAFMSNFLRPGKDAVAADPLPQSAVNQD